MASNGQSLSSSRWAATSRNTSTINSSLAGASVHRFTTSASISTQPRQLIAPTDRATAKKDVQLDDAQKRHQARVHSYRIFTRYFRRLKWKSKTLLDSYTNTLGIIHNGGDSSHHQFGGVLFPLQPGEAETMFKIDFFEFHSILENTLVALLRVFDFEVSTMYGSDVRSIEGDGSRFTDGSGKHTSAPPERAGLIGDSRTIQKSRHRYHANVLLALDDVQSPLNPIMGQGKVRDYLGIAKEWRNKWKNIEEEGKNDKNDALIGSRYEKMIRDLNLEDMLKEILVASSRGDALAGEMLQRSYEESQHAGSFYHPMEIDQGLDEMTELDTDDMMDWG